MALISDLEHTRDLLGNFCLTAGHGKYRALIFCEPVEIYKYTHYLVMNRFGCSIIHLSSLSSKDGQALEDFKQIISKTAEESGRIIPFSHSFIREIPKFSFIVTDIHSAELLVKVKATPVETGEDVRVIKEVLDKVSQRVKEFEKKSKEKARAQEEVNGQMVEIAELLSDDITVSKRKRNNSDQ